jgi:hypothetical protein
MLDAATPSLVFEPAEASDSVVVEVSAEEVIYRLEHDSEFFIRFFAGDSLALPTPDFHIEMFDDFKRDTPEALQQLKCVPRGHAKTTLARLAVVYHILFRRRTFPVLLSNTNKVARDNADAILEHLRNENLRVLGAGIQDMRKASEQDSTYIADVIDFVSKRPRTLIIRAVGMAQQVRGFNWRGYRPDLALIDDVEDLENTATPEAQKKVDLWMFGTFLRAMTRTAKIMWLGNMIRPTTLLARLSKDPAWNPMIYGALVRNKTTGKLEALWPELWSVSALLENFRSYKSLALVQTWFCEMMNIAGAGRDGFDTAMLNYQPVPLPDSILGAFLTLDPAFGMGESADETAITCQVIRIDGVCMVVETFKGRVTEDKIWEIMLRMAQKWQAWTWGIESVAAQRVLVTLFKAFEARDRIPQLINFVPLIYGRADTKVLRIRSWVSGNAAKTFAVPDTDYDITEQLSNFDPSRGGNRDDLIDACASGITMINEHVETIRDVYNRAMSGFVDPRILATNCIQGVDACAL